MTTMPVINTGSLMPVQGAGMTKDMPGMETFSDILQKTTEPAEISGKVESAGKSRETTEIESGKKIETDRQRTQDKKDTAEPAHSKEADEHTDTEKEQPISEEEELTSEELETVMETLGTVVANLVNELAEVFEMEPQEVVATMEKMELTPTQVLLPEQTQELFTALAGEPAESFLLTMEDGSQEFTQLLEEVSQNVEQLAKQYDKTGEQLIAQVIENTPKEQLPEVESHVGDIEAEPEILEEAFVVTENVNGKTVTYEMSEEKDTSVAKTEGVIEMAEKEPAVTLQSEPQNNNKNSNMQDDSASANERQHGVFQPIHETTRFDQSFPSVENAAANFVEEQTMDIMDQMMEQMSGQMKVDHAAEFTKLEMQLHPESLGRVTVELTNKNGELTAQITTQNETVKTAMEAQLAQLRENLNNQGLKVESVEVMVESHAFEQNFEDQSETGQSDGRNAKKKTHRINLNELEGNMEEELTEEERIVTELLAQRGGTVDYTV